MIGSRFYKFIVILLFISVPCYAEPVVKTKYVYYSVSALNKNQLPSKLDRASPIRFDGKIFHGFTQTEIRWKFWWQYRGNQCRITRVKVYVDATITLPKLNKSPMKVYEVWERWHPKLIRHEKQHRSYAVAAARRIEKDIRELSSKKGCKELEQKANQLGKKYLRELAKTNAAYDKRTDHGLTEGAGILDYL